VDGHFCIDPVMAALRQFQLPTIMLGYHEHPHFLRSDNFLGGCLLMRCLLDAGHRHIGIIGLPKGMSLAADQRMNGMTTEYQAHGLDADTLTCVNGTFSSDSGMAATRTLLELSPDLTAILALNDRMAMGAVRQLQEMGYHVPDQISVVGYDDLPQSADFNPPLTTINQQLSDWGTLAMDMLVTLLEGKEPEPIVLPPQLVIRKSTAPPNGHT